MLTPLLLAKDVTQIKIRQNPINKTKKNRTRKKYNQEKFRNTGPTVNGKDSGNTLPLFTIVIWTSLNIRREKEKISFL